MRKKLLYLLFPLAAALSCCLLLFTSLDGKVYDLFLRAVPSLTEDPSVLVITVDDTAIENVGLFPWTRDIYADAIVFLREMGAAAVVFDVSFLDNSPARVDPRYVRDDLPRYLDDGFRRMDEAIGAVMDGFGSGYFRAADAGEVKRELWEESRAVRNGLGVSIDHMIRDVDGYFADALEFFGNSWLTLTMVRAGDILSGEGVYDMDPAVRDWLEENIALRNIEVFNDRRTPEGAGIIPAIHRLISRSRGAGFVNALPDRDGYSRRIHLAYKYNGCYYGHLVLCAMGEMLGNPRIEVRNSEIVLKGAVVKGLTRDIRIPRAQDGSMLLNWPRKSFYSYNIMSSWSLIGYNRLEHSFVQNLAAMRDSGFFSYWDGEADPLQWYDDAVYIQEILSRNSAGEGGIDFDTYMDFRREYLSAAGAFLSGPYEAAILADVGAEGEAAAYVRELFRVCGLQFAEMLAAREQAAAKTEGAFCVVGMAATSMTDEGLITYEERYPNVGTYAVAANQILSGEFLYDAPRWLSVLSALVLSLSAALILQRLDVKHSVIAGLASIVITGALFLACFMVFRRYLGAVVPFAAVTLTFLGLTGFNFFSTLREKSFLRSAFSRYLSPPVIEQIIADPSRLRLGGEKQVLTAIFTDIQRFSSISEAFQEEYGDDGPKMLVNLLNLYLTEMSNIVLNNQGTIDKYEGDAIIAFFGAPIWMDQHAALACRSAIQIKKREAALREIVMNPGGPFYAPLSRLVEAKVIRRERPLYTRLGINTGDMVVGNMGTPSKMDYTIVGNAVNLAARLEGVNKQYDTGGILVSEYTREKIGDEFVIRSLDRVRVVGISAPLRLYELLDLRENASGELLDGCAAWEEAVRFFEARRFAEARELFMAVLDKNGEDGTAKIYLDRCVKYEIIPPPEDWDGVFNLTEK